MTTKHTPIKTPISAHLGQDYFCLYDRDDKSLFGEVMAVPEYHKRKINYIVKCVNAHEDLIEALKLIIHDLEKCNDQSLAVYTAKKALNEAGAL